MVFADNVQGITIIGGAGATVKFEDIHIYGETPGVASSCPAKRFGLWASTADNNKHKAIHPDMPSSLPTAKVKGDPPWEGIFPVHNNVAFHDFATSTNCPNNKQYAIGINLAPDFLPVQVFTSTTFDNVRED